jgi:hypothetical protein
MGDSLLNNPNILFALGYLIWICVAVVFFIARSGIEWIIGEEKKKITNDTPLEFCVETMGRISSHNSSLSCMKVLFALTWPFSAVPILRWLSVPIQEFILEFINPEIWLVSFSAASLCGYIFLLKGTLPELMSSLSAIIRPQK